MKKERGSALIVVILVVLVLTMVGIAGLLFMNVEDRLSGNDQQQKASLYAAESGMRFGEKLILNVSGSSGIDALLNYSGAVPKLSPPGGGYQAVILTNGATTLYDVPLPSTGATGALHYSLYVRNNADDPSTAPSPTIDGDKKVNLISVGEFSDPTGRTIRSVTEEQISIGVNGGGSKNGYGKDLNAGGSNAVGVSVSG